MTLRGMDVGFAGQVASSTRIDVIANNIANATTNAFKRGAVTFEDIFYDVLDVPGEGITPDTGLGVSLGMGARLSTTVTDFQQGPRVEGLDLDVFIQGPGFFRVQDANGNVFYTRLGAFQPKGDGASGPLNLQLANKVVAVQPQIVLPGVPGEVVVTQDGRVIQGGVEAGQFELVTFVNPQGLLAEGDNLYSATDASGPEIVGIVGDPLFGTTFGGALEGSNVDLADELIDLIQASQAFDLSSQAFATGDEELQRAIALVQG